ncbi:tyrosine-tRNA ligase [Calocera cornea HHB12733]|uniref:Tyrosine--tRNA ligase n=1 Tax=Calocera cornea HHB12733 TaxID=1353952 RepID=A0A165G8I2_9BASI|nr:tyrosine-tRNA ligase [Calocera cornea HHB12733]
MLHLRLILNYGRIIGRTAFTGGRRFNSHRANVVDELSARGLLHDTTSPSLPEVTSRKSTVYLGVDPSADSLHVGNLVALMTLLHFHIRGHQVIALVGGGTGMIGDPSGRSSERNLLSEDDLARNVESITTQMHRFLERGAAYAAKRMPSVTETQVTPKVVNNSDWLGKMTMIEFLRIVGKHARVNQMIAKDSVKARLESESGISFTEFSYQLLQAYDFYVLHKEYHCNIQIGGSDQWGNITAGTNLIRHLTTDYVGFAAEAYGLTIPLLTTSSGEKFGKSAGNAVWLKEEKTPVFDFYQFFVRVEDEDVEKYLRMLTFLSEEEITELMEWQKADPELRVAQKRLAEELTQLVHGEDGLFRARTMTQVLYGTNIEELEADDILEAFEGDPRLVQLGWGDVWRKEVVELTRKYGMIPSKTTARRTINQKGFYLNNERLDDSDKKLDRRDFIKDRFAILRAGKKKHLIIVTQVPDRYQ